MITCWPLLIFRYVLQDSLAPASGTPSRLFLNSIFHGKFPIRLLFLTGEYSRPMSYPTKDPYNDGWAKGYRKSFYHTSWGTILIVLVAVVLGAAFVILR